MTGTRPTAAERLRSGGPDNKAQVEPAVIHPVFRAPGRAMRGAGRKLRAPFGLRAFEGRVEPEPSGTIRLVAVDDFPVLSDP